MTEPPSFKGGETEVKVRVPEIAANSKVGFQATVANVNEGELLTAIGLIDSGNEEQILHISHI